MLELHAVVNLDEQKFEKCMLLSILKELNLEEVYSF